MSKKIIFHIPHDGNEFPTELIKSVCISMEEFMSYHNKMRDTYAKMFVPNDIEADFISFDISRLLCDVERFPDEREIMEQYGMGYCYEKAFNGKTIKNISQKLKDDTLKYYYQHHKRLDEAVNVEKAKEILLIDIHSFSKEIIVTNINKPLPDICIGHNDGENMDFVNDVKNIFEQKDFAVALNYPYCGSMIPNSIINGTNKHEITSIMIEVNKSIYITENNEINYNSIQKIKFAIKSICLLFVGVRSLRVANVILLNDKKLYGIPENILQEYNRRTDEITSAMTKTELLELINARHWLTQYKIHVKQNFIDKL